MFRVVTRENASHAATAPTTVSSISDDYAVTVDVDTRTAAAMSGLGAYGITCWNHPIPAVASTRSRLNRARAARSAASACSSGVGS